MGRLRRWLDRLGFLALSGGVVLYGLVRGLTVIQFQLQLAFIVLAVVLLEATISSLLFAVGLTLSGGLLLLALGWPGSARTADPTPTTEPVTAIIPVYGDANVLATTIDHVLASSQPVEVVIVPEVIDHESVRRARELAARHAAVDVLVNTGSPGSKAGAINFALEETSGRYVAVFDADERIDERFLAAAVSRLDARDADVVQGRTVPRIDGSLEGLAYAESVLLSYAARRVLYLVTDFRMAASRAVVCRRDAVTRIGGYDPSMLTEDFDFAYRCYSQGLDVVELLRFPSTIEAAHTPRDWWGQRKRWLTGYAQVLHRLVGDALPPRSVRDVVSVGICASTVVGSLLMLSLLGKFLVLLAASAERATLPPLLAAVGVTALVRLHDYRAGVVDRVGWRWLLVPAVLPLYSLAAAKAFLEYAVSWDGGWYQVEKLP